MSLVRLRSALILATASCSSKGELPKVEPPPPDAAVPVDTITEIGASDPSRFVDPDPTHRVPSGKPARNRPPRPIDVILKSSPPGADAAVDGVVIGRTPAYWYGDSDGREHEFTFVLAGYEAGRYRFVPIQSGTVHARLVPLTYDVPSSTLDPITSPKQPSFTPDPTPGPIDSPRPPDTVITPGSGSAPTSGSAPVPPPNNGSANPGSAKTGSGSASGDSGGFPGMGPKP